MASRQRPNIHPGIQSCMAVKFPRDGIPWLLAMALFLPGCISEEPEPNQDDPAQSDDARTPLNYYNGTHEATLRQTGQPERMDFGGRDDCFALEIEKSVFLHRAEVVINWTPTGPADAELEVIWENEGGNESLGRGPPPYHAIIENEQALGGQLQLFIGATTPAPIVDLPIDIEWSVAYKGPPEWRLELHPCMIPSFG